jgi:hypothetical protein
MQVPHDIAQSLLTGTLSTIDTAFSILSSDTPTDSAKLLSGPTPSNRSATIPPLDAWCAVIAESCRRHLSIVEFSYMLQDAGLKDKGVTSHAEKEYEKHMQMIMNRLSTVYSDEAMDVIPKLHRVTCRLDFEVQSSDLQRQVQPMYTVQLETRKQQQQQQQQRERNCWIWCRR